MKKLILSLLTLPLCAFAADKPVAADKADKYQVTGPVVELTDTKIVVTKASERFEFSRAADTKVDGDLKVGAKVTVKYVMTAATVEVKAEEKKADKPAKADKKAAAAPAPAAAPAATDAPAKK